MLRSPRLVLASVLLLGAAPILAGCGVAENVVGGIAGEARDSVDDAIAGAQDGVDDAVASARDTVDEAIGQAIGGAGITADGELPSGFPADAVPLTGEVLGGGSGPDSTGWVVHTRLAAASDFAAAQAALEGAGFGSSAVDSDADSGFGTFTSNAFRVILTVSTDGDGLVDATYVVTPA